MDFDISEENGGRIAEWMFHSEKEIDSPQDILDILDKITQTCGKSRLLVNPEIYKDYISEENAMIHTDGSPDMKKIIDQYTERSRINLCLYGYGEVYDNLPKVTSNTRYSKSLIRFRIQIVKASEAIIIAYTNTDVWMPFDVDGAEQIKKYAANLGRLTNLLRGLTDIGMYLVQPGNVEVFEHCLVSGFILQNYSDHANDNGVYER